MGREEVMSSTRAVSAFVCRLTYVMAFVTIALVFRYPITVDPFWNGFYAHILSTVVIFIFSCFFGNSSLYDPAWVFLPLGLASGWMLTSDNDNNEPSTRGLLLLGLLIIWAIRYQIEMFWPGWTNGIEKEDWRYVDLAKKFGEGSVLYWIAGSLNSFHLVPTWLVFAALSPAQKVWSLGHQADDDVARMLNWLDFVGVMTALVAILIQGIADRQLRLFREKQYNVSKNHHVDINTMSSSKDILREGLWAYSRHPNYFGEALFWVGIFLTAKAGDQQEDPWYHGLYGCCQMFLFFRGSCILMDQRNLKHREGYNAVMNEVSALVPWFPKKRSRKAD